MDDYDERYAELRHAAERGDAESAYQLGRIAHTGEGRAPDDSVAVRYWEQAARSGHTSAMLGLGDFALRGQGRPRDDALGFALVKMAAQGGLAEAMHRVALLYELGTGTSADIVRAVYWMDQAARRGIPGSSAQLARLRQVEKNSRDAQQPPRISAGIGSSSRPPHAGYGGSFSPHTSPGERTEVKDGGSRSSTVILGALAVLVLLGMISQAEFVTDAWTGLQWSRATRAAGRLRASENYEAALERIASWTNSDSKASEARKLSVEIRRAWAESSLTRQQFETAARLLEGLGEPARAVAAYEAANLLPEAERLEVAAGRSREMADVYAARGFVDDAVRLYAVAGDVDHAAEVLRAAGRPGEATKLLSDAGRTFEPGEYEAAKMWPEAALGYRAQSDWAKAATMYERAGDLRSAADMLENGGNYLAAAEMLQRLAKTDQDVTVRKDAARLFRKAGQEARATPLLQEALTVAKRYGNHPEVLLLSHELQRLPEGIEYVIREGDLLRVRDEFFEAQDAYTAAAKYLDNHSGLDVLTHNRLVDRFNESVRTLQSRINDYPKLDSINGTNYYRANGMFSHTEITGWIRNAGTRPVSSVQIRVKLFKKQLESYSDTRSPPPSSEAMREFAKSDPGYSQEIRISELLPGETRAFSEQLRNRVPYAYFNYPLTGLRLRP